jgi:hypothetical protein
MSLVLHFSPSGFPFSAYKTVIERLEAAGFGSPKGRSYHVCYGSADSVHVTDVWDSKEDFEAFGKILIPMMNEVGADAGQPKIEEVQNIITREVAALA